MDLYTQMKLQEMDITGRAESLQLYARDEQLERIMPEEEIAGMIKGKLMEIKSDKKRLHSYGFMDRQRIHFAHGLYKLADAITPKMVKC